MKITEYVNELYQIISDTTSCKHKSGSCEKCGTSNITDVKHTIVNGVGKVGSLIKKYKKR